MKLGNLEEKWNEKIKELHKNYQKHPKLKKLWYKAIRMLKLLSEENSNEEN